MKTYLSQQNAYNAGYRDRMRDNDAPECIDIPYANAYWNGYRQACLDLAEDQRMPGSNDMHGDAYHA
jgi:hypothetical protein